MIEASRLLIQLQRTKLQNTDNPLFQLLSQLIGGLSGTVDEIKTISGIIDNITNNTTNNVTNNSGSSAPSLGGIANGSIGLSAISVSNISPPFPRFTPGSVIFAGAAGQLTQDNTHLFFNDALNRLGVNNGAPSTTFEVTGDGLFKGNSTTTLAVESVGPSTLAEISVTGKSAANVGIIGGIFADDGSFGTSAFAIKSFSPGVSLIFATTFAGERMRILSTGEVGIGDPAPTHTLDVAGTLVTTGPAMALFGSTGAEALLVFNSSAGAVTFSAKTDGTLTLNGINSFPTSTGLSINMAAGGSWVPMVVTSNGGSAGDTFIINAAGRVGIGVVAPTADIHIKAGTATASTAPLKFTSGTLLGTPEVGAVEFLTDAWYGTITTGTARKQFLMNDGTAFTVGSVPFATTNGRLTEDNANLFWDDANDRLGIGTASPARRLELVGAGAFRFRNGASDGFDFAQLGANSWSIGALSGGSYWNFQNTHVIVAGGRLGVGGSTGVTPTALIHLAAGTATANTAPLKFTSGTNLTTAEAGSVEYDGTNLFFTRAGTVRENVLVAIDNVSAPSTNAGTPTTRYGGDTKYLGDPNRWLSVNVLGSTYKIPLYN